MKINEIFEGLHNLGDDEYGVFLDGIAKLAKANRIKIDGDPEVDDDTIEIELKNQPQESDMDAFEGAVNELAKKYKVEINNIEWRSDHLTIYLD
jgi:hypothetical protein